MSKQERESYRREERLHAEIRRYSGSCGCEVGSVFLLGALLGNVAYLTSGYGEWTGWGSVAWVGLWIMSLSAIGKLIGLGYARVRLLWLYSELDRETGGTASEMATSSGRFGLRPSELVDRGAGQAEGA